MSDTKNYRSWFDYEEGLAQATEIFDTSVSAAFESYGQTSPMGRDSRAEFALDQVIGDAYRAYKEAKLKIENAINFDMPPILKSRHDDAAQFLREFGENEAWIVFEVALARASYLFRNALIEALKFYEETWRLPAGEYEARINRKDAVGQAWGRFQEQSGVALTAVLAQDEVPGKQALYRSAESSLHVGGEMPDRVRDNVSQIQEDLLGAQDALDEVQKSIDFDPLQRSMEDLEGSPFFKARKATIEIQEFLDSTFVALDKLQSGMVLPEAQQTADQARHAMKQAAAAVVLLQRDGVGHPDFFELTMSELVKLERILEQAAMDLGAVEVGLEYRYKPADL